jgi:hypothetical protein
MRNLKMIADPMDWFDVDLWPPTETKKRHKKGIPVDCCFIGDNKIE